MRFTISREKLQEGLTAVTATIPTKTTLPVLSNILVETTDKGITPIAVYHGREPAHVPHQQRIVEAKLLPEIEADLRRNIRVQGQFTKGVTRSKGQDGEQYYADPHEHRHSDKQSTQEISRHGSALLLTPSATPSRGPGPIGQVPQI